MRIVTISYLKEFYIKHNQAEKPIRAWIEVTEEAVWKTPHDIKKFFRYIDVLPGNRVVFNIGGNKYRLVAKINYKTGTVYTKFIGTHAEYDKIDAEKI